MGKDAQKAENPFLTKEELVAHLKGQMFPKGKQFAPSLVMWGDPHGDEEDIDHLDHMASPDDGEADKAE